MRRFFYGACGVGVMLLSLAAGAFVFALSRTPVFADGEGYEISAGASSSAAIVQTDDAFAYKLFHAAAGESVRYEGDVAARLIKEFSAKLCFYEQACGVSHYYLYTPRLGEGVFLNGYAVNLHIAVRGERTVAGTPLIFGGV